MYKYKEFILAGILALVLSFALFGNGIGGDFVFDDTIVIVGNPFISGNLDKFWDIFTNPYFAYQPRPGLYRPLTIASYSLNAFLFGQSPASFHTVNIVLHALVSFLVFILLYRLSNKTAGFMGLLFFMFLPIHVETVTSIVGRAEILSLLFVLGAMIFATQKKYFASSGLFLLGLLSKEMTIAFLPIFLFIEYKNGIGSALKKLIYFAPSLVLYGILRYVALGSYFLKNDATPVYNPIKFTQFLSGIWTSFKVFYLYLEKTFFPATLSSDYSFDQIKIVSNPLFSIETIAGIAILGLLILLFFKTRNSLYRLGIVVFLASYFVISNWIFKTGTIMAERLMYTPSLGLVIIAASFMGSYLPEGSNLFGQLFRRRQFKFTNYYLLLTTIFVWYGFIIIDRNRDWLNDKNLYESAYVATPNSLVNRTNMAYLDFIKGNYNEAENRLNEVLNIAPDHVPALNLAAQNYKKLGQYQKAEEHWKKVIKLRNDYLRAYLSLGILYYENGYFSSAEKVLTDAVNIYPRWSEVLFLALTKVGLDKPDEAILLLNRFSERESLRKELKFALGWAYFNKGDRESAYRYFNQVKDPKMSLEGFVKTFEGSKVVLLGEF